MLGQFKLDSVSRRDLRVCSRCPREGIRRLRFDLRSPGDLRLQAFCLHGCSEYLYQTGVDAALHVTVLLKIARSDAPLSWVRDNSGNFGKKNRKTNVLWIGKSCSLIIAAAYSFEALAVTSFITKSDIIMASSRSSNVNEFFFYYILFNVLIYFMPM
jgi:hypothetical protein